MANVISQTKSKLEMTVTLELTESEAKMLIEMTGYGVDAFIKGYYKMLGKHYMIPHEQALRSFFKSININLPDHVRRFEKARDLFYKEFNNE